VALCSLPFVRRSQNTDLAFPKRLMFTSVPSLPAKISALAQRRWGGMNSSAHPFIHCACMSCHVQSTGRSSGQVRPNPHSRE
jgi:hypothetical protein